MNFTLQRNRSKRFQQQSTHSTYTLTHAYAPYNDQTVHHLKSCGIAP